MHDIYFTRQESEMVICYLHTVFMLITQEYVCSSEVILFPLCFSYHGTEAKYTWQFQQIEKISMRVLITNITWVYLIFPIILVFYCFPFILMLYFSSHYVVLALTQINLCGHKTYIQREFWFLNAKYKCQHLHHNSLLIPKHVEQMNCSSSTRNSKLIRTKASRPFHLSLPAQSIVSSLTRWIAVLG